MYFIKKYLHESLLLIILIIGLILRFYNLDGFSLSNDELSALSRIRFDNLKDLIIQGVKTSDFHPAGVQIFLYYWTKIFGISVFAVRFPFAVTGAFSIVLIFLIGSRWFNKTTGLFAALAVSFLEFPLLYSQIARPYSSGLFVSLLMILFWTLLLFGKNDKKRIFYLTGYVISTTLCMYNHYFSFLFAIIVGLTGLFFLQKSTYKSYLTGGVLATLLFLPHLSITLHQFSQSVEDTWVSKPENDYLLKHIQYTLNDSKLLFYLFLSISIFSALLYYKNIKWSKFHIISLVWFILPFLIGYTYSIYIIPVLQYSILIFSFPCFLMFIFSFFKADFKPVNIGLFALTGVILIYSTVWEQKYYKTQHFGEFKAIAEDVVNWNQKYGSENITQTININGEYYIDYYLKHLNSNLKFERYIFNNDAKDVKAMVDLVNNSTTAYFLHAWSTKYNPYEISEIIKRKYPVIAEQQLFFNSEVTLYKKAPDYQRQVLFYNKNDFESNYPNWSGDTASFNREITYSGNYAFRLDSLNEFSPDFTSPVGEVYLDSAQFVTIFLKAWLAENATGNIVMTFESDGKMYDWHGVRMEDFVGSANKWGEVIMTRKLPEQARKEDKIKIYAWNTGKKIIYVDDIELVYYGDSRYHY